MTSLRRLFATLLATVAATSLAAAPALAVDLKAVPPGGGAETITGKYVLLHADALKQDLSIPALAAGSGTYRLHGKPSYHFRPGQPVQATGAINGRDITVSTINATEPAAPTPTSLNVLVELVYWTSPDGVTSSQAQQQYAVTNNTWFANDSYGALHVNAAATGWLSIPAPTDPDGAGTNTPCDNIDTIQNEGDAAASAAGYDPAAYSNVVYYYPNCAGEQWGGWGQVGGSRTWLIGEMDTRVAVHELGHNLGLNHSHSQTCTENGSYVPYSTTCSMSEYGDPVSAMGGGFSGQGMYAPNQQAYLGWLGSGGHGIATVTSSGTYTLAPYESMAGGTQALKVTNSLGREFWIEYRQPIGDDAFLWSGETDGVTIRSADGTYSNIYDMAPSTAGDFSDAVLQGGQTWADPTSNLSVRTDSANASAASVTVTLGTPPPSTYLLTVSKSGTGAGTISSAPSGISCGSTCSASFPAASSVTLTESPISGSVFSGWGGACAGTSSTCTVSMSGARSVTAGFAAAPPPGTRYEEPSAALDGWAPYSDGTGTFRASTVTGNTAQFPFSGTSVTWLTKKGPAQGKAQVTIDGVNKGTFDTYASSWQPASAISFAGLAATSHKIVVKVLGTKNAASTAVAVAVDGFTVGSQTTQESWVKVLYESWKGVASSSASGGTFRSTATAGRTAAFTFNGTGVDWVTATGPGWGKAEVYVDGADKGTVDLYAATLRYQSLKTYSGLTDGTHTITIKVLGTKNAAAKASTVSVDGFVVH